MADCISMLVDTTAVRKHHLISFSFNLQVATIFVGIAVLTAMLTIFTLILMFFMKSTTVFHICGWMQILSGKTMSFFVIFLKF